MSREPDGMLCTDCVHWIAYSDLPVDDDQRSNGYSARDRAIMDAPDIWMPGDSEQDDAFSWRPCDRCGCTLGGSRHGAYLIDTEQ